MKNKNSNCGNPTTLELNEVLPDMILPFNKFEKLNLPNRDMLLDPWIQNADQILISGAPGTGKTWFAMEICSALQNGRTAINGLWDVKKSVKSMYCDGESHWDDIKDRGRFVGFRDVHILSKTYLEYNNVNPSLNLDTQEVRDLVFDYIIENNFKFVVLDNLYCLWAGIDLDNAQEWNAPNQWLLKLRSRNICVMLLHHTNKAGKQMGTVSKLFNINTGLVLKEASPKRKNSKGENIASFYIKVEKQRKKGAGLDDYIYTCNDGAWSYSKKKNSTSTSSSTKGFYIVLLLLDGQINKQSKIASLVGCKSPYITQVKKEPKYKIMFKTDGSPTTDGHDFLKKNKAALDSFYNQKGVNNTPTI